MGANIISNSWGGSDAADTTHGTYLNHPGVVITASTGDSGYGVQYPASSQYVTAVGGTHLVVGGGTRGWTETAWSGAGSGCSTLNSGPSAQSSFDTGCPNHHAVADVSAVADPNTGVAVRYNGSWLVFGGTSGRATDRRRIRPVPGAGDTGSGDGHEHPGISPPCRGKAATDRPCHVVSGKSVAADTSRGGQSGCRASRSGTTTSTGHTAASATSARYTHYRLRSPSPARPPTSISADATASADSSTNTNTPPNKSYRVDESHTRLR